MHGTSAAVQPATMTNTSEILEAVTSEQLDTVTGAGIGTQIGSLFGQEGARWGGIADSILGMFGGASGGGIGGGGAQAGG